VNPQKPRSPTCHFLQLGLNSNSNFKKFKIKRNIMVTQKNFSLILIVAIGVFFVSLPKEISAEISLFSLGPNLINNSDLESASPSGDPTDWARGRWGNNIATFEYPATGHNGSRGNKVTLNERLSGDAKWYFKDVAVSTNKTYEFSDYYQANASSHVTARYLLNDGSYKYIDLITDVPVGTAETKVNFSPPTNAVSLTIFHLINQNGYLITDNYSLREIIETPTDNLIANSSLEMETNGQPSHWFRGRWGNNIANFIYPINGNFTAKAARVELGNRLSGDAKWYFEDVTVSPGGFYSFEDDYRANTDSYLTARYKMDNGQYVYSDLAILPPSQSWKHFFTSFKIPGEVSTLTIFHLIKNNGWLETDNFDFQAIRPDRFNEGLVTLAFDDGPISVYENALPILRATGHKTTQYIVTGYTSFPGYMNPSQVFEMFLEGHEIGSHSLNHADLTALAPTEINYQLSESKKCWGVMVSNVTSFAYPFGYNNSLIKQLLAQNGYGSGRATIEGVNVRGGDPYALKVMSILNDTSFLDIKNEIDQALIDKSWLILLFHQVNHEGDRYSTTPETLSAITNYLNQKQAKVVTVSEGTNLMNN